MNTDSQYILYNKLDRRTFPKLYLHQIYTCDKLVRYSIKNKKLIITTIRIWLNDSDGFYAMHEPTFDKHFMTVKEYRKQKLLKINSI